MTRRAKFKNEIFLKIYLIKKPTENCNSWIGIFWIEWNENKEKLIAILSKGLKLIAGK